jgi:hypothetical protein
MLKLRHTTRSRPASVSRARAWSGWLLAHRRLALVLCAGCAAVVVAGTAIAAFPDTDVKTYTGCLTTGGTVNYVKEGTAPLQPCSSPKQQVKLSGGDITKVSVTGALTGGGENGAVSIGLDASKTVPANCSAGQVAKWGTTAWGCGTDNDTTYTASTGLDLAAEAFSVKPSYRLPQGCGNGAVAKSDGSGGWTCATDAIGGGPTAYFNTNEHVVESFTGWQEVGGLSGLPGGSYVFTTAIHNRAYITAEGVNSQALLCITLVNGQETDARLVIPQHEDGSDVWAATVPAGSSVGVTCVLRESNGGFFEDDATLANAHVTALRLGALNP